MINKRTAFLIIAIFFLCAYCIPSAYANIKINLVVVNPSSDETKKVPVTYYLPKELEPDHLVETSPLTLNYDVDKASYFLEGTVELGPSESTTIKITVKDVWRFNPTEVDMLKLQIDENIDLLKETEYYDTALLLKDDMLRKLNYIGERQKHYSENIERRIEEFRAHKEIYDGIVDHAFSVDYFKSTPSEQEAAEGTVRLVIEVENPLQDKEKEVTYQHYLPREVRAEDIVDRQGFDVRFDEKKNQSYLSKEETFGPGEKKRYTVVLKDIWQLPLHLVEQIRERAEKAMAEIKGSDYEGRAQYISDIILNLVDEIEKSQRSASKSDMRGYIGTFRTNERRFEKASDAIDKLEKLLAVVQAKKLEEYESSKVTNVLEKIQALRGIMALSKAIFGKRPSLTTTWRIIWGILTFIALFTTLHFFSWWKRSKLMGEEVAEKTGGGEITEIEPPAEEDEEEEGKT